jgi:hypothetical protein
VMSTLAAPAWKSAAVANEESVMPHRSSATKEKRRQFVNGIFFGCEDESIRCSQDKNSPEVFGGSKLPLESWTEVQQSKACGIGNEWIAPDGLLRYLHS